MVTRKKGKGFFCSLRRKWGGRKRAQSACNLGSEFLGKRDNSKFYTSSHVISLVKQNSSLIRFECFVCFMNSLKLAPNGYPQLTGWPLRLLILVFSSIFRSLQYLLITYWWDLYTHRLQTQWYSEMIREWQKRPLFYKPFIKYNLVARNSIIYLGITLNDRVSQVYLPSLYRWGNVFMHLIDVFQCTQDYIARDRAI